MVQVTFVNSLYYNNLYDLGTDTMVFKQLANGSWSPKAKHIQPKAYGCALDDEAEIS